MMKHINEETVCNLTQLPIAAINFMSAVGSFPVQVHIFGKEGNWWLEDEVLAWIDGSDEWGGGRFTQVI
jgi:hypothetical protein